jgi:hypothetical protein
MHNKAPFSDRGPLPVGRGGSGQAQILAVLLFLLLIPATAIIAQNATVNSTFTGDVTEQAIPNISKTDQAQGSVSYYPENITLPEDTRNQTTNTTDEGVQIPVEENDTRETPPENQTINIPLNYTNETESTGNVTVSDEWDKTINETLDNEDSINETQQPEPLIPEIRENINQTINQTVNETETEPSNVPVIEAGILSPDTIIRGGNSELMVYAKNIGSASAHDVIMEWILPDGFMILSGSGSVHCQELAPETSCWNNITATASLSSYTGLNDVKVRVKYVE